MARAMFLSSENGMIKMPLAGRAAEHGPAVLQSSPWTRRKPQVPEMSVHLPESAKAAYRHEIYYFLHSYTL